LERALSLAEPEGYVRTFVDEGMPMAALLRKAAAGGLYPDYVDKLLAALESEIKDERKTPSSSPSPVIPGPGSSPLVEPLSGREIEVLRLIAAGLSNREIADELFLAIGTVKKHINNIFGKLNVRKRTQAVARARELGML
jgi:LuxR family maltose regulon positive regulatory protein